MYKGDACKELKIYHFHELVSLNNIPLSLLYKVPGNVYFSYVDIYRTSLCLHTYGICMYTSKKITYSIYIARMHAILPAFIY